MSLLYCSASRAPADTIAPDTTASTPSTHVDPQKQIAQHLALGTALLEQGDYTTAQLEFRAILELDATHSDALRLMTKAQQRFEAKQTKDLRAKTHLREQAQELAVKFAREKAKAVAQQQTEARGQVARAREQQLKFLYNKGLGLYRQGQLQGAIDLFQQMVLLDPTHPLVREAQRLIVRAETKQAEVRARAGVRLSPNQRTAAVSDLEQQLTTKRIEIDTVLKYAKVSIKERNHDMAIELLQRVLVQDPEHRQAQQLLHEEQLAKLKDEQQRVARQVEQDEQVMVNDVIKAQQLPPQLAPVSLTPPSMTTALPPAMVAKLREPITLDFTDVALNDVLEFIGDAANVSIIPSPQLDLKTRRVSLKVTKLPLELALKYLAKNQSLAYRVEQDAILLATEEEFSNEPMETRVFFLRNGLGPFALETAAIQANPALAMESVRDLIEHAVPQVPDSKIVVDERTGALVVTNTREHLALVEQLLTQLDVTPLQVLIEARFIELTMTDLDQFAVESVLTGDYSLNRVRAPNGGGDQGNILTKGAGFKFPAMSREDEGVNLTLEGVLSAFQFEAVLHALEETKKSKTLSSPRITALNNQTATIRVVEQFNYPRAMKSP